MWAKASMTTLIIGFGRWSITALPLRSIGRWRFFRLMP